MSVMTLLWHCCNCICAAAQRCLILHWGCPHKCSARCCAQHPHCSQTAALPGALMTRRHACNLACQTRMSEPHSSIHGMLAASPVPCACKLCTSLPGAEKMTRWLPASCRRPPCTLQHSVKSFDASWKALMGCDSSSSLLLDPTPARLHHACNASRACGTSAGKHGGSDAVTPCLQQQSASQPQAVSL